MSGDAAFRKVVLIGAAGNIGSILLSSLVQSNAFDVTVLSRASSESSFPPGVTVAKIEYTQSELVKVFKGQDAIISAVGALGFSEQQGFIDAAIEAGVKRFIPSEMSSNTQSEAVLQLVPMFAAKKEVLDYLKVGEPTGLTWTGLAVGPLLEWGLKAGFLGYDLANKRASIWDHGNTPFSLTSPSDLGKAVINILKKPAQTANKYLYIASVTTTQMEILKSLESATGEKWTVQDVKTEEQLAKAHEILAAGDPNTMFNGVFMLVQAAFWGNTEGIRTDYTHEDTLANDLLDIPAGNLDAATKRALTS